VAKYLLEKLFYWYLERPFYWSLENPFFLNILPPEHDFVKLNLGEPVGYTGACFGYISVGIIR
jgi:hypothetical protein